MHFSTVLPISLSLISGSLAQSVVSIDVVSGGATAVAAAATGSAFNPAAAPSFFNSSSSGSSASPSNGTISSSSNVEKVWVVKVGSSNGTFAFAPNTVNAAPGDWVQFQFEPRNHSVVTASYDSPCVPNVNSSTPANTRNVFYTGFMPTADEGLLTYTVPVQESAPMWFYCSQQKHCQDGMVGVINPPSDGSQSLKAFIAAAAKAPENLSPDFSSGNSGNGNSASSPSATSGSGSSNVTSGSQTAQSTKSSGAEALKSSFGLLVIGTFFCLGLF